MLPLLLVVFIVVPIVEIWAIIQVGQAIGVAATVALLLADSILGAMLMRSQGRAAWRRFNAALTAGRPPAREVLDGVLIVFGGAFLVTPGFVTDVLGLALLLPPSRAVIRRVLVGRLAVRAVGGPIVFGAARASRMRRRGRPAHGDPRVSYDVEGTATDEPRNGSRSIERDPRRLP